MLEHQIEKLTERVGELEAKQDKTNDLLAQILSAIQSGGLPPAQPDAKETPKAEKPAKVTKIKEVKDEAVEEPEPGAGQETSEPATLDEVRDALMAYNKAYGKAETQKLMEGFIEKGAKPVLASISRDQYDAVIAACVTDQKEAA